MAFELQPSIENPWIRLEPLRAGDFEALYSVASDPLSGQANRALKTLMLEHAFRCVDRVIFHVGAANLRSRKAMEKLGGVLIGEVTMSYHGEQSHPNVIYKIDAADWALSKPARTEISRGAL